MKKIIFLIMIITNLVAIDKEEKIVAQVNDTLINNSDLMIAVNAKMSKNFFHGNIPEDKMLEFKLKTLSPLINRELVYQYALKNSLISSEKELIEEEQKIINALGGKDTFLIVLKRNNMNYEYFKSELKKEKANMNVYKAKIEKKFTDEDLEKYYEQNKYKFKKPESISVQLIYVKNNPNDSNGTAISDKYAQEAYDMIISGDDFGQIAKEYSDDKSRINDGIIKNLHKGMIDESVEKEAFKLNIGEVSKIIKKPVGSYIVKVLSKKPSYLLEFEEIEGKLKKELKENREKEAYDNLIKGLRKDATVINFLEQENKK